MELPNIDVEEIERRKKQNFEERLAFLDKYAAWVKKTANKDWSKQQNILVDAQLKSAQKRR